MCSLAAAPGSQSGLASLACELLRSTNPTLVDFFRYRECIGKGSFGVQDPLFVDFSCTGFIHERRVLPQFAMIEPRCRLHVNHRHACHSTTVGDQARPVLQGVVSTSLALSLSLSLSVSLCPSLFCPSLSQCLSLSVPLSLCPSLSLCLSLCPSLSQPLSLAVPLSLSPSLYLSLCLSLT